MAWNNSGGGPWGGNGGGRGGGGGPWGRGPSGGGGPTPPDLEEAIRRSQDRLRTLMPNGMGSARGLALVLLAALTLWLGTGFYKVEPDEQGVVMLFGKWVQSTQPGLHWYFPTPVGQTLTPKVERINRIDVGFRGGNDTGRVVADRDVPEESLMLTGDQNISDVDFTVFWKIKDAGKFLFNIRDPEGTVKLVSESAMREVIGQTPLEEALTGGRRQIEQSMREALQEILDEYGAGITVTQVQLLKVDPPGAVIDAFNEVQRARQDKERKQNEAEAYRNKVVPTARGEAARLVQEAEAYKEKVIKDAEGEAQRFVSIFESFLVAKDVTRQRLYLETLEEIMRNSKKMLIDEAPSNGGGVVPYLSLNELMKSRSGGTQ